MTNVAVELLLTKLIHQPSSYSWDLRGSFRDETLITNYTFKVFPRTYILPCEHWLTVKQDLILQSSGFMVVAIIPGALLKTVIWINDYTSGGIDTWHLGSPGLLPLRHSYKWWLILLVPTACNSSLYEKYEWYRMIDWFIWNVFLQV